MKCIISIAIAMLISITSYGQISAPSLSPSCTSTQKLGLSTVTLSYSRPSMKGRTAFGPSGLIAYNEYWRTGANTVTTIDFSDDVQLAGQEIAKGKYSILSKLTENTWTIFLYPYEKKGWSYFAKQEPAYTITSDTENSSIQETLYIGLENINLDKADLVLSWSDKKVRYPLHASAADKMLKKIDAILNGPSLNDYFQASVYLHESGIDLDQALTYIQKVTSTEKARFFHVYRELLILNDLKKYDSIEKVANRTIALAKEANNLDIVRSAERILDSVGR